MDQLCQEAAETNSNYTNDLAEAIEQYNQLVTTLLLDCRLDMIIQYSVLRIRSKNLKKQRN